MKKKNSINGANKYKNGAHNNKGAETDNYNRGNFTGNSSGVMQINKNKIKEVAVIVLAWLFALAFVYMVLVKISILFR